MIDVLPADAIGPIATDWPALAQVCRVTRTRRRKRGGKWLEPSVEVVYLITSLSRDKASPAKLLRYNRRHWGIEIMHRDKDALLGEDGYTNRKGNAPKNVAALLSFVRFVLRAVKNSPTKAVEFFQDDKNPAIGLLA
jgi:hypothetical protein